MKQIEPTYTTFEQSKWLKEIGFNQETDWFWNSLEGNIRLQQYASFSKNSACAEYFYSATEQLLLAEWLWVEKGIWIQVEPEGENFDEFRFSCFRNHKERVEETIRHISNDLYHSGFKSPQAAYSSAFDYIKNRKLI
jgi:hypothetical protein